MPVKTGEILFVKCVKCGIPNRDPLRDSDARRLFGEDDGRISLSDVSIKRDVRDYVVARFPEDGPDKTRFVFVQKKLSDDGRTLLGRDGLAQAILEKAREGRPLQAVEEPPAKGKKSKAKAGATETDEKGDLMAAVELEDLAGSVEVIVFPRTYQANKELVREDNVILVRGKVDTRDDQPKILAESIEAFEAARDDAPPGDHEPLAQTAYPLDSAEAEAAERSDGPITLPAARYDNPCHSCHQRGALEGW